MSRRSIGAAVVAIGVVLTAVSALADQIGIGDESKFGTQQMLGVAVGVLVAVVGFVIVRWGERKSGDTAEQ